MPQYLSPGVYIEEVASGNQPIVGVSTSTAGIVGMAERGPVNIPILVTSFAEYQQWFGGYLPINLFSNGPVAHCYLPHAIEGFFTNGGSLAYVTRVIDPSAPYSSTFLFDRGDTLSASTILLRRAGADTGTVAAPPALCVLDSLDLTTPGTWFRVGDGSNAEYKQVDSAALENLMVALAFPLSRSHASGTTVQDCTRVLTPTMTGTTFAINGDGNAIVGPDLISLHLTSPTAADVTAALALALPTVIEIGYNNIAIAASPVVRREYRFVTNIIKLGANDIEIVLDSAINMDYAAGAPVSWITPSAPVSTQSLGIDASAGDSLIFASTALVAFTSTSDFVLVDPGSTTQEIRRIGQLHQLGLTIPSYGLYPSGSVVEVAIVPSDFSLAVDAASGANPIFILGGGGFAGGASLTIANSTSAQALSVTSTAATETLQIQPALVNAYTTAATVTLSLNLAQAVTAGNPVIVLNDVNGVGIGMSITLKSGAKTDTLTVQSVDATTGFVTFTAAPANSYPTTATVTEALTLAAPAAAGATAIVLTGFNGFTPGMSVKLTQGGNTDIPSVTSASLSTQLNLGAALTKAYAAANTVLVLDSSLTKVAITAVAVGVNTVELNSADGLAAGMKVILDSTGVNPETVFIKAIGTGNVVTFSPPAAFAHSTGAAVVLAAQVTLTAPVTAGSASNIVSLSSRLGMNAGDLLQIGFAPNVEFAVVIALPQRGAAPDAGAAILSVALQQNYAVGTPVVRSGAPQFGEPSNIAQTATPIDTPAGSINLLITDGSGAAPNTFASPDVIRVTIPTGEVYYHTLASNASVAPAEIFVEAPVLERSHAAGQPIVGRLPLINVEALDPGAWGNRIQISVQDEPSGLVAKTSLTTVIDSSHIKLLSPSGVQVGTVLELFDPASGLTIGPDLKVAAFSQSDFTITLQSPLTIAQTSAQAAAPNGLGVRSREFRLTVYLLRRPDPAIPSRNTQVIDSETFRWLSMDPRHANYLQTIIGDIDGPLRLSDNRPEGQSKYIRVHDLAQDILAPLVKQTTLWSVRLGPETLVDTLPDGRQRPAVQYLENGDDAISLVADTTYIGSDSTDPVNRTGMFSLENLDNISIIACPGQVSPVIGQALIDQCELMQYRMAVLDGPPPPDDTLADVQALRQNYDTEYAAIYHPWLLIPDPFPTNLNNIAQFPIPPCGHTMGVYARVDDTRGVFKAPANELLNGITGLQRTLSQSEQDILNPFPVNINVNRDFRSTDRGIRIYGGRIITSDSDWKYVNVRRLMMYIEQSLYQGLQWVVFEPNAQPLWARVRRSVSDFLKVVWRNGGLQGATYQDAFYVLCDQTTMTQTEIENGELIILVGVAPVYPAEFVIVRIGLWTANAS